MERILSSLADNVLAAEVWGSGDFTLSLALGQSPRSSRGFLVVC